MSLAEAEALGLELAWQESISLTGGIESLADIRLFVDDDDSITYLELVVPKEPINNTSPGDRSPGTSADQKPLAAGITPLAPAPPKILTAADRETVLMRLQFGVTGPAGRIIDEAEANRLADNEKRRLERRGFDVTKRTVQTPRVLIYSLTQTGTLQRRNAETGELEWQIAIGQPGIGYGQLGISSDSVLVTNGGSMFQVAARTGKMLGETVLRKIPSFGAISVGRYGVVQSFDGSIYIYDLSDVTIDPYQDRVRGTPNARPVNGHFSSKIAWPTSENFVYVAELEGKPSTAFRLQTDGIVTGSVAAGPNEEFYFGTDRGQVYGIRATTNGEVLWTESLGVPVIAIPVLLENHLFVDTAFGELYSLELETGARTWDKPVRNIAALYAAFDDRLYCENNSHRFVVLDAIDGSLIPTPVQFEPVHVVTNRDTNRLYLVSDAGLVQCFRPEGSELPRLIYGERIRPSENIDEAMAAKDEPASNAPTAAKPPTDNPFGGGDDPFGGAADPFGGAADPFGGDPFGGDAGGADPFGGGEDPFGGDPFN